MASIKLLPEDLINKIAAGEVVERPASVVKELLDNAYDAKATSITIDIEDGGQKKILVIDNGTGMDKDDALLAFKPHATSKISSENDLLNITKYGFRGEALASIASVSKVTLKTRKSVDPLGTMVKIEGGTNIAIEETGAQAGTSVLIEDLFYNVPARREFLKQTQTEYRMILDVVNAHALANPHVGLTFINNGKVVYAFPKDDEIEDRTKAVVGKDTYEHMVSLFFEHPHLEIYGFISKPQIAAEKPKNQFLFINKRRVHDKTISGAIKEAFGTLLHKTLHPQYVIFVQVQPNIVDVNVHPRKEEVRFSNSQFIFTSINQCVKKALERNNLTATPTLSNNPNGNLQANEADPFSSFGGIPKKPMPGTGNTAFPPKPLGVQRGTPFPQNPMNPPGTNPFPPKPKGNPFAPPFGAQPGTKNEPVKTPPFSFPKFDKTSPGAKPAPIAPPPFGNKPGTPPPYLPNNDFLKDSPWDDDFGIDPFMPPIQGSANQAPAKFIQIKNLYIVMQGENGMLIYDQHALHERINYEKLIKTYKEGKSEGNIQPMLAPLIVNFSAQEHSVFEEYKDDIEKAGFKFEDFGPHTIKVTEIPAIFAQLDIKSLLHEFLVDLESDSKIKEVDSEHNKVLTYLSCRSSYKANDTLDPLEIQELLDQIEDSEVKYTCPHGRPLKIEISYSELEKMFKRTGF